MSPLHTNLFDDPPPLTRGKYQHYKGGEYEVLDLARHSESLDWMVVYRPLYGERGLWVRPYAMFIETVTLDGETQPRFRPC
jgi:hypothetical protein